MNARRRVRRGALASTLIAGLLATTAAAGAATAGTEPGDAPDWSAADWSTVDWSKDVVDGSVVAPTTPNPYLANVPGRPDYLSWETYAVHRAAQRRAETPRGPRSSAVDERPGSNGRPEGAQRVFVDTSGASGTGSIDVIGRGPVPIDGTLTDAGFAEELDGSIADAQPLPVLAPGDTVTGTGTIGDEVDVDFDFFALPGLRAGDTIVVDIDTPVPFGDLDPFVGFWGSDGPFPLIDQNDDDGVSFDSLLQVTVPADGDYFVSVGGFGAFVPEDPFDPASPSITGDVGSTGDYEYTISSVALDVDFFKFDLDAGDVVGATVLDGGNRLELYDAAGNLLIGSSQDLTFIHPADSPLPGGGNASLSYVVDRPGRHYLAVSSTSDYTAQLRAFRPTGDVPGRGSQVLFLDFDGGSFDVEIFGGPPGLVATLSPLSAFLPNWGLAPADEDAVIDAIVASVIENLRTDIETIGGNDAFDIVVLNSRDHVEPTGPLVSRIIVGGTIAESGIPTVGIAQSIDVGNFDSSETAIVLLDLLSAPDGAPDFIPGLSLNSFPLAPGASIVDLVGVAVGNITAHEAGHFFANWHTDQFNPSANIMDQGGNLPGTIGIGPDGVFGSADDVDVDFGEDTYVPAEGFIGTEDTLTSIGFGLWSADG